MPYKKEVTKLLEKPPYICIYPRERAGWVGPGFGQDIFRRDLSLNKFLSK
jgi:hypothetical protein